MKNTDKQETCIAFGREAARAEKPLSSCPYQFDLTARSAWLVGWEQEGGNLKSGLIEKRRAAAKTIYHGHSSNKESVVIANDEAEARLLLGGNEWAFVILGTAVEPSASDVISLVEAPKDWVDGVLESMKSTPHRHVNCGVHNDDSCKVCGKDLRNEIHYRVEDL